MLSGLRRRCMAALLLVLSAPLLASLALLVRWRLGSPVFFRQIRPGLGGRPFVMYKFRTMRDALGPNGSPLPDTQRLPRFGRFLRSTSLDELPELINILRGEMAFIGPRPLLMDYLPLYNPEQMRRHDVLPGITGWAQVNGRNAISWDEKFALDVWYVDNHSFWIDCRIVVRTVLRVLRRSDINPSEGGAMPLFTGCDTSSLHAFDRRPASPP